MTDPTPLTRAIAILDTAGIAINERRDIPHGVQLRLDNGAIANVYMTGSVVVQGPPGAATPVRKTFDAAGSLKPLKAKAAPGRLEPRAALPAAPANEPQATAGGTPFLHPRWSDKPADPGDDTPPW